MTSLVSSFTRDDNFRCSDPFWMWLDALESWKRVDEVKKKNSSKIIDFEILKIDLEKKNHEHFQDFFENEKKSQANQKFPSLKIFDFQ